jgi:Ca2+-transporting ATPase
VETLGSVNVICTDKTGTLTQNKMRVVDILPAATADANATAGLLRAAALCNNAHSGPDGAVMGTATEAALLTTARDHGIDLAQLACANPREGEIPFSSARKRMSTIHRDGDDSWVVYVKGAAEAILERSTTIVDDGVAIPLDDDRRRDLTAEFDLLAGRGRRMLGLARRVFKDEPPPADAEAVERDLELLGFVGIVDPLREEVVAAVAQCRAAGVRAVMITGDHVGTARAIADELGLLGAGDEVLVGRDIEAMGDEQLRQCAPRVSVYARVSPEHKLRIVRAHQAHGAVVAMTGDGVNDAPALKQADIGVAMGITGTDVSKEASNMILADDNFATIVSAVAEGRVVYDNIRKFVRYLLTTNCGEVMLLFMAILVLPRLPLPLLPVHLLWINLVTDGLPALALGFEPAELGVMRRPPRRRDESVFADHMIRDVVGLGLFMAVCCLALYWYYAPSPERLVAGDDASIAYARTAVFVTLAMFQLFYVMAIRSSTESLFTQGLWSNYRLTGAVALGFAVQMLVIYTPPLASIFHAAPLGWRDLIICLAVASTAFVMVELHKALSRRSLPHA